MFPSATAAAQTSAPVPATTFNNTSTGALNASNASLGRLEMLATGLSALSSVAGGISSFSANNTGATLEQQQADMSVQQSNAEAIQKARQVSKFQSDQAETYLSSGVTLQGSPLAVLAETHRLGQQEVDAIRKQGQMQSGLLQGRANLLRTTGRNAMLGGFAKAGGSLLEGKITGQRLASGYGYPYQYMPGVTP